MSYNLKANSPESLLFFTLPISVFNIFIPFLSIKENLSSSNFKFSEIKESALLSSGYSELISEIRVGRTL